MRKGSTRTICFLAVALVVAALLLSSCAGTSSQENGTTNGDGEKTQLSNDFSFLVCGDPHGRTDLLSEIVAQAREGEFLVVVGDITTGKGRQEMQDMKDYLDSTGIQYFVIPGDNDMPQGDRSIFQAVFGPDYYSIDVQDSHLVFLNDAVKGEGVSSEQLAWLGEDLAEAGDGKLLLAFAHVPPGAPVDMSSSGFLTEETDSSRVMQDMLEQAGAPVIYCGHLHAYMLFSSGPPRVVVTGGAGANPHLSAEAGGFHHFLRVTVKGDEVSEEIIPL